MIKKKAFYLFSPNHIRFISQKRPGLDHTLMTDTEFHIHSANPNAVSLLAKENCFDGNKLC